MSYMTRLSRRHFLSTLTAAGVVAGSSGWFTSRLLAMANEGTLRTPRGPGMEGWVPTLCRMCPAACGIRVRLVDGLPVGVEGDRTNPLSAGGLCPAGFAVLHELVHPDRVRTPLRRDGPRGSGRWIQVTWDEALGQIAAPLRAARAAGRPEAFAVLERGDSALTRFWLERVLHAYGSPNLVVDAGTEAWRSAWEYMAGVARPPAPDLSHSDFILSFGQEWLETEGHPVWQTKSWGRLRAPETDRQATGAYVGPRVSPTASHADLRVAVRPGTEGTLALGLVHVLILENLIDRQFLDEWTSGFRDRPKGTGPGGDSLEAHVRNHFGLEEVSWRTGAPVSEIFRLGRAFGTSRRPLALIGSNALARKDGLASAMAVIALNLAVGSVGRAGGYVSAGEPPLDLPEPQQSDAVAKRGLASARVDGAGRATLPVVGHSAAGLAANLIAKRPYPLDVLLVHGVNPVHEWADGKSVEEALAAVGLLAVVGTVADDTARIADLILPESSALESWQMLPPATAIPFDYVGLQQPVLQPLYRSRAFEDMWFELARRIGGPAAAAVPAGRYADWLPSVAAGLLRSGRGTIAGGSFDARIAGFMEERGWNAPGPQTAPGFWDEFRRSGSWVATARGERSPAELLGDRAARFDLWPSGLLADARELGGAPLADIALYPGAPEAASAAESSDHPLQLLLFDTNTLWAGRTALTPVLLEMSGFREDIGWDSWVEIHPETATRHRIHAGERVRVESAAGSLVARARIAPVVPTDAVAMPRGLGHRHFGRFANGVGVNPMSLVSSTVDRWTGAAILETRVRLTRMQT
jgi:anaerobic selenocysteine-containing dehydrogenase